MAEDWIVHTMRPDGCIVETRGMLISLWTDALRAEALREIRKSILAAHARTPEGLTTLSIYRNEHLSSRALPDEATRQETISTLRLIDNKVVASASVLEVGDFMAATMRSAIAGIQLIVRPKVSLKIFNNTPDALSWLLPQTVRRGGLNATSYFSDVVTRLTLAHTSFLSRQRITQTTW
jgi:hypothetical protein